jgi:hypothetical protein
MILFKSTLNEKIMYSSNLYNQIFLAEDLISY